MNRDKQLTLAARGFRMALAAVADAPDSAMPESTGLETRDPDAALTRTRSGRAGAKVTT
jgi:hypothetical protein